jgi:hypothetical protein
VNGHQVSWKTTAAQPGRHYHAAASGSGTSTSQETEKETPSWPLGGNRQRGQLRAQLLPVPLAGAQQACIRPQPSWPAASASAQQFALVPGASAVT